jgi:hypothetical protein
VFLVEGKSRHPSARQIPAAVNPNGFQKEQDMLRFLARLFGGKPVTVTRPRPGRPQVRPGVEELTPRVLLNAGPLHMAAAPLSHGPSAATMAGGCAGAGHGPDHGLPGANLAADLTNASGGTGTALVNSAAGALQVQVRGAAAGSTLSVAVDGTTVGSITTDASGNGQGKFTGVTAQAGSTIAVGDLQGTLAQFKFSATLSGTATGVSGTAFYDSLKNQLHVAVSGAAANTTYNVTVGGTVVGQLTTNASGKGHVTLTPSNVTIQAGTSIAIGDTLGNAAILQGTFA